MTEDRTPLRDNTPSAWLVCSRCNAQVSEAYGVGARTVCAECKSSMQPDPHDACKETIKAREKEGTELRYRVRELEKDVNILAKQLRDRTEERDEREATVNILRKQIAYMADVRRERDMLRRSLQGRCHWRPNSDTATLHGVRYFWCMRHEVWHRIGAEV